MKYYCYECEHEVLISESERSAERTAELAKHLKVVCEDCVSDMKGVWAGKGMFARAGDDDE
jgi:hypothetical protein